MVYVNFANFTVYLPLFQLELVELACLQDIFLILFRCPALLLPHMYRVSYSLLKSVLVVELSDLGVVFHDCLGNLELRGGGAGAEGYRHIQSPSQWQVCGLGVLAFRHTRQKSGGEHILVYNVFHIESLVLRR